MRKRSNIDMEKDQAAEYRKYIKNIDNGAVRLFMIIIGHLTLNINKLSWYINRINTCVVLFILYKSYPLLFTKENPFWFVMSALALCLGIVVINIIIILAPNEHVSLFKRILDIVKNRVNKN